MKKLMIEVQPGRFTSSMFVFENVDGGGMRSTNTTEIPVRTSNEQDILAVISAYINNHNDVEEVGLIGPNNYTQHYIDELETLRFINYKNNNVVFKQY